MKARLDQELVRRHIVDTRSQAESYIRLGKVTVDGEVIKKAGFFVPIDSVVALNASERYVSRAGLKLSSVAHALHLEFADKIVLDVGSSTGGFTDYALQHGAAKVIAVDVGTEQLHPSLRNDTRIELHEKTDIRDFMPNQVIDIVVIDVSFISLRQVLPHIANITKGGGQIAAMVKPQFEAGRDQITRGGIVKNDRIRRDILRSFEQWVKKYFVIVDKSDSAVAGANGNKERFYLLKTLA